MKVRLFLLTLLLANLVVIPAMGLTSSSEVSTEFLDIGPLVESRLKLEIESSNTALSLSSASGVRAVLEFKTELSESAILAVEQKGIMFERRESSIVHSGRVYNARVRSIESLQRIDQYGLQRASSGSKKFFPAISSSVPAIGATDVWSNLKKDGSEINGSGVTIAVIDTGVAWLHPSFWRVSSGPINVVQNGLDYYADLDNDTISDANEGPIVAVESADVTSVSLVTDYLYIDVDDDGVFDYGEGDRWLGGIDADENNMITIPSEKVVVLGESKVSYLYDQENNNVYVRGVNLTSDALSVTDYHGHGSHVASTALGGQPGYTSMVGAAPGADLIVIRSPLESSDVIDGIHFAVLHGADIINMSFSSYLGFLDGTDLEDLAVTEAFRANGTLTTLAAGNLGGRSKHARFDVSSGGTAGASISVHSPPQYSFLNILWRSADDNEHVILNPPSGDPIDLGQFSTVTGSAWQLEFEGLNAYVFADTSSRGTNRIIVQLSTGEHNWTAGSWSLTVTNPSGEAVWVDAYTWDNSWTGTSLTFTSMTDSQRTISSPGTADLGVVVTSYAESGELISSTSSRGPRIDGFALPKIAAPGVGIRAASRSLTSLWSTRSGSSMAAPHVAGVLALIRQASDDAQGWTDLSALSEGAGGNDEHYSPANPSWGHGLCDAVWSVQHILEFDLTSDIGSWTGIPMAFQGATNLTLDGSLDITEVRVNPEVESLNLAVTMRSEANYSSDNVLRIQWDVDGSLGTGEDGIDVVVNITDDLAQVFEWSVDQFQTSTLSTEWLSASNVVSVSIQIVDASQIGQLTVSTHNSSLSSADSTSSLAIPTLWRPTIDSLSIEGQDGVFDVSIVFTDKDTPLEDLNVGWSVADGGLSSLLTGSQTGNTGAVSVDVSDYDLEEIMSVIFNCSDTSNLLFVPPLALSSGSGLEFEIVSANLDRTVIHVGPFIQEHLTGQIVIAGADFASEVQLALLSFYGTWFNFTLIGSEGVYSIDILLSGFSPGNYEAYAVAHSQLGTMDELHLGTLSVVEDYAFAFVAGGALLGVILIITIVYIKRKRTVT